MVLELIYLQSHTDLVVALPVSGYIVRAIWTSHYTANWAIGIQIPNLDSLPRDRKKLSLHGGLHETGGTMSVGEDAEVLCFTL
jgi:hypothetical protein